VIAALDRLLARDPSVDVRRLQGNDEWRLRVGDWRVRLRLDFDNNTSSSCAEVCIAAAIPVWERLNRTRTHDLLHGKQFVDPSFQH